MSRRLQNPNPTGLCLTFRVKTRASSFLNKKYVTMYCVCGWKDSEILAQLNDVFEACWRVVQKKYLGPVLSWFLPKSTIPRHEKSIPKTRSTKSSTASVSTDQLLGVRKIIPGTRNVCLRLWRSYRLYFGDLVSTSTYLLHQLPCKKLVFHPSQLR